MHKFDFEKIMTQIHNLQDPTPDEMRFAYAELKKVSESLSQMGPKYTFAAQGAYKTMTDIQNVLIKMNEPVIFLDN